MRSHSEVSSASVASFATRRVQKLPAPLGTDQKFRLGLQTLPPATSTTPLALESTSNDSALNVDTSPVNPNSESLLQGSSKSTPATEDFPEERDSDLVKTPTETGGDRFDCPYCLQRLSVQDASGVHWR
jgi:hypothetical protein